MAKRDARMVSLGYGKFVKADRVYALVPIESGRARRRAPHLRARGRARRADRRLRSERAILADVEAALTEAAGVPRRRPRRRPGTRRTSSRGASDRVGPSVLIR